MEMAPTAKILIVEDENITALDVRSRLQALGYDVPPAVASAEEAIARVAEVHPDLVLMDIVLKGKMDGVEAAGVIRSRFHIPVVYLTAFSDSRTIQRAKLTEPFGYVLKPFEERDLHATIEMALYKHRMEEQQRQSEERYRMFSELASDYVYSASVNGDVVETEWVTGAFERVTGYSLEELKALGGWPKILHPDDVESAIQNVQEAKRSGGCIVDYRIITKGGETRWLRDYVRPVWDTENQRVVRFVGGVQDITERKKTEQALLDSQNRLARLNECLLSFGADADDNINRLVALCGEQLGASAALYNQLEGENLFSLGMWNTPPDYNPLDKAEGHICYDIIKGTDGDVCVIRDLQKSRYAKTDPNVSRYGLKTYIGKAVSFADAFVGSLCVVYMDDHVPSKEDLELLGIAASAISVEEKRKRAEEKIMMLGHTIRSIGEAVSITDLENHVLLINEAFRNIYGYEEHELIGMPIDIIRSPNDQGTDVRTILTSTLNGGWQGECLNRRKDGTEFPISLSTSVVRDEEGRVVALVGVAQDITERKAVEKQLRASVERQDFLLRSLPMAFYTAESSGNLATTWISEQVERLTGLSPAQFLSDPMFWTKRIHPDDRARVLNEYEAVLYMDSMASEYRWLCEDGSYHWFLDLTVLVRDEQGTPREIIGTWLDITERKKAEEQLRKLSRAVEQSLASVMITNIHGDIEYVNPKFTQVAGYTLDEVKGKNPRILKSGHTPSEEYERLWKTITSGGEWRGELLNKKKNGELFWEYVSISPITNAEGTITHFLELKEDVTERKLVEQALRDSERKYRTLFENTKDAVYMSTPDGRILDINSAGVTLLGYSSKDEVRTLDVTKDLYFDALDRVKLEQLMENKGYVKDYELVLKRKDGTKITVLDTSTALRDGSGAIIEYRGILRDLTEWKQLEQQLYQAQKMESMGTLVGGISHDFNNILNNIIGFVHQMRKYSHDEAKIAKYTDTIEKSATRGADLANQLLSFVRQKRRDDEATNLKGLVDEVYALMVETFPKNITLVRTLDVDSLYVMGNHGELFQALLNLCLNARDAMPQGGTLTLEVAARVVGEEVSHPVVASTFSAGKQCIEIRVSDTGTGIPDTIRDRIFDPFFTTKERGRGTGLGLSVVYNIVRGHKGTIVLESEEGKGSAFVIYLPSAHGESGEITGKDEEVGSSECKGLVLLVDDEVPMQELGRELLEDEGYQVLIANDGMQAVEIYRERWREIDLVVLDLVMPKLDGGQTFLELKKINPAVKTFFCTGYSSDQVITSLLAEEHLHALQKPFRPKEFAKLVREVLAQ
jgi:PAS domain S-box-containing protein